MSRLTVSKGRAIISLTAVILGVGTLAAETTPINNLNGRWAATITTGGLVIPFRLDISSTDGHIVGTLYNGQDTETTTSANVENGAVKLNFEHYLTSIQANIKDGELDGQIVVTRHSAINITPGASMRSQKIVSAPSTRHGMLRPQRKRQPTFLRSTVFGNCPMNRQKARNHGV